MIPNASDDLLALGMCLAAIVAGVLLFAIGVLIAG